MGIERIVMVAFLLASCAAPIYDPPVPKGRKKPAITFCESEGYASHVAVREKLMSQGYEFLGLMDDDPDKGLVGAIMEFDGKPAGVFPTTRSVLRRSAIVGELSSKYKQVHVLDAFNDSGIYLPDKCAVYGRK